MHMHDAKGKSDHLPLGTGELDLAEILLSCENTELPRRA